MTNRKPLELIKAQPASDGDGVKLLRVFGGAGPERFDPFLMLDEFGSNEASDYIGGFPPHPHRGFETITYMLQGKMEHQDHMGNIGLLNDGDVQWMTAGRGVIHSEMPRQTEGRMRGFQLWLNLPAADKMQPAQYRDVAATDIPSYDVTGATIKAIAGSAQVDGQLLTGYLERPSTNPLVWDIRLQPGKSLVLPAPQGLCVMAYVYEGQTQVAGTAVNGQQLLRLSGDGDVVSLENASTDEHCQILLLMGQPLHEPIVQYGPFVMNSHAEIEQAISDYRAGNFTEEAASTT